MRRQIVKWGNEMSNRSFKRKHLLLLLSSLSFAVIGLSFNNCSNFHATVTDSASLNSSSSTPEPSGDTPTTPDTPYIPPPPPMPSVAEPVWMKGKPANEWFQIPDTSGNGGSAACAFSGMALKESTSEIVIAAAGGHGDSADNRVVSIRLDQDSPKWIQRSAPSLSVTPDVPYYSDGKPASRHTYFSTQYVPQLDRVMLIGAQFVYGRAVQYRTVDGFNLQTNTWDPAGKWPDANIDYGKAVNSATGDVWSARAWGVAKWSPATGQQVQLANVERDGKFLAMQNAWDSARDQLVSIGFGDGFGYGNYPTLNAYKIDSTGKTVTTINFNPSAGLTAFLEDKSDSGSLEYDRDGDRFLYFGNKGVAGRIFVSRAVSVNKPFQIRNVTESVHHAGAGRDRRILGARSQR